MIKLIIIAIIILSLLDLGATYLYINSFHKKFPTLDYTTLEANPILKLCMKYFGLTKGMLIGGIIVLVILLLIVFSLVEKWAYYLAGAFTMMLIYHFLNFSQLLALKPAG